MIPPSAKTYGNAPLVILALIGFLLSTDISLVTVLIEPIKHDNGLSDVQIGFVQGTAFGLAYGLSAFPMGWLIDRTNRVRLLGGGLAVWIAALVLTASAHSFGLLVVSRLMLGVVAALLVPAALSLIADFAPLERRARATSTFAVGQTIGASFGILAGGLLHGWLRTAVPGMASWRIIFLGAALAGVPFLLLMLRLPEPGRGRSDDVSQPLREGLRDLAKQRSLLLPLLGAMVVLDLAMQASSMWIPSVLTRNFGLQPSAFAVWLSPILLAAGILGALSAGWLGDWATRRLGSAAILLIAGGCALVMAPLSAFVLAPTIMVFALVLFLYLLAGAIVSTLSVVSISVLIPSHVRGLALGANLFTATIFGTAVAPVAVARFSQTLGGEGQIAKAIVYIAVPCLFLAAVLLLVGYRAIAGRPTPGAQPAAGGMVTAPDPSS